VYGLGALAAATALLLATVGGCPTPAGNDNDGESAYYAPHVEPGAQVIPVGQRTVLLRFEEAGGLGNLFDWQDGSGTGTMDAVLPDDRDPHLRDVTSGFTFLAPPAIDLEVSATPGKAGQVRLEKGLIAKFRVDAPGKKTVRLKIDGFADLHVAASGTVEGMPAHPSGEANGYSLVVELALADLAGGNRMQSGELTFCREVFDCGQMPAVCDTPVEDTRLYLALPEVEVFAPDAWAVLLTVAVNMHSSDLCAECDCDPAASIGVTLTASVSVSEVSVCVLPADCGD